MVCRAFKKRTTNGQTKTIEGWETGYFYDEPSTGVSSIVDPIDYIPRHNNPNNFLSSQSFLCKQELEADNLSFNILQNNNTNPADHHHHHHFVQLPQLESPSLPLIKRPSSVSLISEVNEEEDQSKGGNNNNNNNSSSNTINIDNPKKVVTTDWRALDKFVASQLSQDQDRFGDGDGESSSFGVSHHHEDPDTTAFMLLQSSTRDEGNRLNAFLNSSSADCDFGICIFEK